MNVSPFVKYNTYLIAKGNAPVDTGNLKENAIRLTRVKENSWTINYDTRQALYIEPLEEGSKYMEGRRFIYATANEIALYLKRTFEGKTMPRKNMRTIARGLIDTTSTIDKYRREDRRIESILRYETEKQNFKVYENKYLGVNL